MFRKTSPIRRWLCRASFWSLCAAPTIYVCGWAVAWNLPSHRAELERALSGELGLTVKLESVAHPRPGLMELRGLQAGDPETDQSVLRIDRLKAAYNGVGLVLVASHAEIEAASLPAAWDALERTLVRRPVRPALPVRILANELTLRWPERSETLASVAGRIENLEDGPQATLEWRGRSAAASSQFFLFRDRRFSPPRTGFKLATGDVPLDLSLLSPALPVEQWLGPRAQFTGDLWARRDEHGWSGMLAGELTGVDLESLAADHGPYDLRGPARLLVSEARFVEGRLQEAAGQIEAGPGFVSQSLLQAAATTLRMKTLKFPEQFADARLPYERLSAAFSLDSLGLTLSGRCREDSTAVMIDRQQVLLAEAAQPQPQPVAALARLFAPPNSPVVPLDAGTPWLLQWMPLPDSAGRLQRRSQDRLRRADSSPPLQPLDPTEP